ncbi:MAG: selenocysteine-specific translation elongation factor [Planctomycetia bacterium]|nr:selenocysteine-specific translation elongation factor [Planctomycetia bacterium]
MTPRTLTLGTAGHIDHGKTTLLRALTRIDTDRLPEEKQRGITIDIGFAHLDLGDFCLGIVDVPGHERFIKNMLAGAVGIDLSLLVVAADDSVMPQTREHLAILQMLGIRHGLVVITKCDRAEPTWLDLVEDEIRTLVAGTFLEAAPIVRTAVPASGPPWGLDELRAAIASVCQRAGSRQETDVFRLPIDRAFSVQGLGTVVTGTVWSGRLGVRDEVEWLPAGKKLVVRGLQNHGHNVDSVTRGQRAAINLIGVHHGEILRGHELATADYLAPSKLLTVDLQVLSDSPRPIKHRSRQRLYVGTQEVMVAVSLLEGDSIEPGQRGLAQLYCAEPAMAAAGQSFVMRAESPLVTIGGGRVLQPRANRITKRQIERFERLAALGSIDEAPRAAAALYFYGIKAWTELDLCRDANLPRERCHAIVQELQASGRCVELQVKPHRTLRIHRDVLQESQQRILNLLRQLHVESPLWPAIPRDQLLVSYQAAHDRPVIDAIVNCLIDHGVLRGDDRAVALADFVPQLTALQTHLREQIIAALHEAGLKPPDPATLCQAFSAPESEVRQVLDLCAAQGELVHLGGDWYLHPQVEADLRQRLKQALQTSGGLTMSQIRELLETSRKYAVPICEHLDRIGFTRRNGDLRVLHQ